MADPFNLADDAAYAAWRSQKLATQPHNTNALFVPIKDLSNPRPAEIAAISRLCHTANMAIYTSDLDNCATELDPATTRQHLHGLVSALGLTGAETHRSALDDGFVALEVANDGTRRGYIPYTNKPLSWHTDGYYNQPNAYIRAFVLHCVRDSSSGGENALLDPELAYIRLRDNSPKMIAALMHPQAMTIPQNIEKNGDIRITSVGPVFWVDDTTGRLQMRYSARQRNIVWRDDAATRDATAYLTALLASGNDVIRHRLQPGQGLICNNVLHNRSGFENSPHITKQRLYFRARFGTRVKAS